MNTENNSLHQASSSNGKVLVAEDNLMNQKVIQTLLRKEGYQVSVVSNGLEALRALEQHPFNLLVLDYQMPELDGFETLKALRNHAKNQLRQMPVIFLTAELNQEKLGQIEQYGVSQTLSKPIEPRKLIEAVAKVIKNSLELKNTEDNLSISYLHTITDGNANLMVELIDIFLEEAPLAIQNMKVAHETKDFPALLKIIHKIRSNYKYVGMLEGEKLLADLEKEVALNQNAESFMARIQEIENLTQTFLQALTSEKQRLQQKKVS